MEDEGAINGGGGGVCVCVCVCVGGWGFNLLQMCGGEQVVIGLQREEVGEGIH